MLLTHKAWAVINYILLFRFLRTSNSDVASQFHVSVFKIVTLTPDRSCKACVCKLWKVNNYLSFYVQAFCLGRHGRMKNPAWLCRLQELSLAEKNSEWVLHSLITPRKTPCSSSSRLSSLASKFWQVLPVRQVPLIRWQTGKWHRFSALPLLMSCQLVTPALLLFLPQQLPLPMTYWLPNLSVSTFCRQAAWCKRILPIFSSKLSFLRPPGK